MRGGQFSQAKTVLVTVKFFSVEILGSGHFITLVWETFLVILVASTSNLDRRFTQRLGGPYQIEASPLICSSNQ